MLTCNKTKRLAKLSAGIFYLFSQSLSAAQEYPPSSVEMVVKKVSEHVYYVEGAAGIATDNEGFISNAGFVVTEDGVVVFDSLGTPSLAKKLLDKISEVTKQPVKKVIVSHFHADHIYGLQVEVVQVFFEK